MSSNIHTSGSSTSLGQGFILKPRTAGAGHEGHGEANEAAIARFIDAATAQDTPSTGQPRGGAGVEPDAGEGGGRRRKTNGHRGRKKSAAEMRETERLTITLPGAWIAEVDRIAERAGRSRNALVSEVLRRVLRLGTDPLDEILVGG